jgi:hypothetical protein
MSQNITLIWRRSASGWEVAGVTRRVPQPAQNFAAGSFCLPHFEQLCSATPQLVQKLLFRWIVALQFGHFISGNLTTPRGT